MQRDKFEDIFNETRASVLKYKVRMVRNLLYGEYNSVYMGEGLEFAKFEEFGPDSNPRQIDIVSSLKSDTLQVARECERREARLLVVCDVSPSMLLREKPEIILRGINVLLFSALDQHIRTGLVLNSPFGRREVRPGLGNKHVARVRDALADMFCSDETPQLQEKKRADMFELRGWEYILTQDSYIIFFSDFLGSERNYYMSAADKYNGRYRVAPVIIQDDLEYTFPRDLPRLGRSVEVFDAETQNKGRMWINRKTGRERADANEKRFESICYDLEEKGIPFAHLSDTDIGSVYSDLQEAFNALYALRR